MLARYFFRRFFSMGFLYYSLLLVVLLSCNLITKLSFFQDLSFLPLFILTLVPVASVYALPLASCLSVYISISMHFIHDELFLVYYLKKARRALTIGVVMFALLGSLVHSLMVFEVTPRSYKVGKHLLFAMAQKQLLSFVPGKFHELFPGITIFFQKKSFFDGNKPLFEHLFLAFNNDEGMNLFTARQGYLKDNQLILHNGSLHSCRKSKLYVASFQQTTINIDSFFGSDKKKPLIDHEARFLSLSGLVKGQGEHKPYFIELHKRIAQVGWQFALPYSAYVLALLKGAHSVVFGLTTCGLLFLGSYVLLMLASFASELPWLALVLFYVPILLLILILGLLVRRKTNFF